MLCSVVLCSVVLCCVVICCDMLCCTLHLQIQALYIVHHVSNSTSNVIEHQH